MLLTFEQELTGQQPQLAIEKEHGLETRPHFNLAPNQMGSREIRGPTVVAHELLCEESE